MYDPQGSYNCTILMIVNIQVFEMSIIGSNCLVTSVVFTVPMWVIPYYITQVYINY